MAQNEAATAVEAEAEAEATAVAHTPVFESEESTPRNSIINTEASLYSQDSSKESVYQSEPSFNEITFLHECTFIFFMCMSQLLTQAANAQTMPTMVQLGRTFKVSNQPGEVSWFSAAYSLTVGTFILISGRLGDMFGYKKLYVIGYIWFGIFSLLVGFSGFTTSTEFFTTMRGLQGIGPAIMMPNSQALIGNFYPTSFRKNFCFACFGATAPVGFIIGALFSGMFADLTTWKWTFWTCGIISILLALLAVFVIPNKIGSKSGGKFDYWGSIVGVTGLVLINFAFNQGPNVGWNVVYVYVLLIVGFAFMCAFHFIEKHVEDPLVPPSVLRGDTGYILACISAGWSCFGVWLYYMFRWALLVDKDSAIMSAVKNIPAGPVGMIAAVVTAVLLTKVPSAFVMFFAMIAFLVGVIIMGTRPVGQIFWAQKFVSMLIQPIGMDMSFPAGVILLSAALPRHQQGIAGSLVSTFVNYSISIGLGFAGTVEYYTTKGKEPGFETTVLGIRNAYRMGMGLAGFGLVVSTVYLLKQLKEIKKKAVEEKQIKGDNII
ncbi:hypothetical protein KGF56_004205 [Candida oxycetoniae]|uniref:Major facilitator superfamily (MFS) profile domain-containing protein n=1 Tax=Candida oxycetoniae TaxID=497107 RepID=A0AAI9STU8_9ASCO|nr:uncharacterized protein KGF56_004205 [Candida oxycetoniae]KAI3402952.1 hypothetical protein KGF56_004205 [Candida oxycetoniae]